MYAMALVDVSTPVATASGCAVTGDLRFKQRQLLPVSQPRLVYNYPVVNWTAALMDPELVRLPTIVRNYTLRDGMLFVIHLFTRCSNHIGIQNVHMWTWMTRCGRTAAPTRNRSKWTP